LRFQGNVWRHVPAGAHPLHAGYILQARGRWNRAGLYGCLYTSLEPVGAVAEYLKYLQQAGISPGNRPHKRKLVSLQVNLSPVMDLTDPEGSPVPPSASFLVGDSASDLEACRNLADSLRSLGYAGIIAPSSPAPAFKNLMIYLDHTPSKDVQIMEGADRIAL